MDCMLRGGNAIVRYDIRTSIQKLRNLFNNEILQLAPEWYNPTTQVVMPAAPFTNDNSIAYFVQNQIAEELKDRESFRYFLLQMASLRYDKFNDVHPLNSANLENYPILVEYITNYIGLERNECIDTIVASYSYLAAIASQEYAYRRRYDYFDALLNKTLVANMHVNFKNT